MKTYCGPKGNAAFNKHFRECERQGLPFMSIRNKRLYTTVHYDLISCSRHNGTVLNIEGHKGVILVTLLYLIREWWFAYYGAGITVGFLDTLKPMGPALAESLWPVLSDTKNRISPEERRVNSGDTAGHCKLLDAWINEKIVPTPGFREDFRKALKTKIPLIEQGWEIKGDSLIKRPPIGEGGW